MTQRPGREPNTDIDSAAILYWFAVVTMRTSTTSAYYLEKYYKKRTGKLEPNNNFIYDQLFTRQESGKNYPKDEYRLWFASTFPETCRIRTTPLWKLLKKPDLSQVKLFELLDDFPFDITIHLILSNRRALQYFDKLSNLDSLAACLWMMSEFRTHFKFSPDKLYKKYLTTAFQILCRIAADEAFKNSAKTVFSYFHNGFVSPASTVDISSTINEVTFNTIVLNNKDILKAVNELNLLKNIEFAPPECIPIAQKKLTNEFLPEVLLAITSNKRTKMRKHPSIQRLRKNLHRWQKSYQLTENITHDVLNEQKILSNHINKYI